MGKQATALMDFSTRYGDEAGQIVTSYKTLFLSSCQKTKTLFFATNFYIMNLVFDLSLKQTIDEIISDYL